MLLEAIAISAIGLPAIIIDYRSRRIPNALVLMGLAVALALGAVLHGVDGLVSAALGAVVGLVCLLPMYLAGPMGAGDVKFMAAMGAVVGPGGAVYACAAALLAGACLALATLGWRRFAELPTAAPSISQGAPLQSLGERMPYAAAIVTGALVALLAGGPRT